MHAPEDKDEKSEKDNKPKPPILNIEFSSKGELLAVSYDNAKNNRDPEGKLEKEGSYVCIF